MPLFAEVGNRLEDCLRNDVKYGASVCIETFAIYIAQCIAIMLHEKCEWQIERLKWFSNVVIFFFLQGFLRVKLRARKCLQKLLMWAYSLFDIYIILLYIMFIFNLCIRLFYILITCFILYFSCLCILEYVHREISNNKIVSTIFVLILFFIYLLLYIRHY